MNGGEYRRRTRVIEGEEEVYRGEGRGLSRGRKRFIEEKEEGYKE